MHTSMVGETRIVLRAILSGVQDGVTFYGGGAQCGINETGHRIALERLGFGNGAKRTVVGNSIGAVLAGADVFDATEDIISLWSGYFCRSDFIQKTLRALWHNEVIRIEKLREKVYEVIRGRSQPEHSLYVGHTELETGRFRLRKCDLSDREGTTADIIGSCFMPALTKVSHSVDGVRVADPDVAKPIPIAEILDLKPNYLLIVLSGECDWYDRFISVPKQNLQIMGFSREKLTWDFVSTLWKRGEERAKTMSWILSQLNLSLDSPERVLPPTCVVSCSFQDDYLQTDGRKMMDAVKSSFKFWHHSFQAVM